jgi:hypothetical protein
MMFEKGMLPPSTSWQLYTKKLTFASGVMHHDGASMKGKMK